MSYSKDLRERAVSYYFEGHSFRVTAKQFTVGKTAVENWVKIFNETGGFERKPLERKARKFDPDALKQLVKEQPFLTQAEIGAVFGGTASGAEYALKKNKITLKKLQKSIANETN